MLILKTGKCDNCICNFDQYDTVQSTDVTCEKCKKTKSLCHSCKEEGCECGGKFLDAWDKNPDIMQ